MEKCKLSSFAEFYWTHLPFFTRIFFFEIYSNRKNFSFFYQKHLFHIGIRSYMVQQQAYSHLLEDVFHKVRNRIFWIEFIRMCNSGWYLIVSCMRMVGELFSSIESTVNITSIICFCSANYFDWFSNSNNLIHVLLIFAVCCSIKVISSDADHLLNYSSASMIILLTCAFKLIWFKPLSIDFNCCCIADEMFSKASMINQ